MKGQSMSIFKKNNNGGFMDVIRCDEPSYLIWKWHPTGSQQGNNTRENAIRWGSSLRVKDGEVAVFVYDQNNGSSQDFIEGPFDQIITTANLPVLASIIGLAYDGGSPFQAEVYFINLAQIIQTKFAVPFFDIFDPRFSDFGVPVAVRGTISFQITDYIHFIKLHRLTAFNLDEFQKQIRDAVSRYTKDVVTNAPAANNIPVVQIETKIALINDAIEYDIATRLNEDFGVTVSGVDISAIEIDKSSDGYRQLLAVTKDVATATIEAQTAANIKDIYDKQRIEAENYQETLRIQREEGQYATHKQTQSANMDAFKIEKQAEVGIAGANALGQMGTNGAGGVDLGSNGGSGFNPAAMMASMAVGGAVGQNIAETMNGILSNNAQQNTTPPPIPKTVYNVVVNGESAGPYDNATLIVMAQQKQIDGTTLAWKPGMEKWVPISEIAELKDVLSAVPPEISQ